jgi:hypothetical protein
MPMGAARAEVKATGPLNAPSGESCSVDGPDGIAPMLRLADQKILIRSQAFSLAIERPGRPHLSR